MDMSVILLAGGKSTRMGMATPKPFLPLGDKPIVRHSFDLFASLGCEIIVVAPELYHDLFPPGTICALPGRRRQDSLLNGLRYATASLICIHDAARPFLKKEDLLRLIDTARKKRAAALAIPVTSTIKEAGPDGTVIRTLPREALYEIQTPQIIAKELLQQGFAAIGEKTVTDDISLIEHLGLPVTLVEGSPTNTKITHPSDLSTAHAKV